MKKCKYCKKEIIPDVTLKDGEIKYWKTLSTNEFGNWNVCAKYADTESQSQYHEPFNNLDFFLDRYEKILEKTK